MTKIRTSVCRSNATTIIESSVILFNIFILYINVCSLIHFFLCLNESNLIEAHDKKLSDKTFIFIYTPVRFLSRTPHIYCILLLNEKNNKCVYFIFGTLRISIRRIRDEIFIVSFSIRISFAFV